MIPESKQVELAVDALCRKTYDNQTLSPLVRNAVAGTVDYLATTLRHQYGIALTFEVLRQAAEAASAAFDELEIAAIAKATEMKGEARESVPA